jgi:hypothetical protein
MKGGAMYRVQLRMALRTRATPSGVALVLSSFRSALLDRIRLVCTELKWRSTQQQSDQWIGLVHFSPDPSISISLSKSRRSLVTIRRVTEHIRESLAGKGNENVRSIEHFYSEYDKVDTFIEDLGRQLDGNFKIYRTGFWPSFVTAVQARYDREVRPHLLLSLNERLKNLSDEGATQDQDIEQRFIEGGADIPRLPFVLAVRFAMRGAFQELVEEHVLLDSDRAAFMAAMPHWATGLLGMQRHKDRRLLSDVLEREIIARASLIEALRSRGRDKAANAVLAGYGAKLRAFWAAVRRYPEAIDDSTSGDALESGGAVDAHLLFGIDTAAVIEYVQHMFPPSMADLLGVEITPLSVGGTVISEIEHGFTHAASMPQPVEGLDNAARAEISLMQSAGASK